MLLNQYLMDEKVAAVIDPSRSGEAGLVFVQSGASYKPGEPAPYVYFPASCFVSLQYLSRTGGAVEIAAVGTDGLVGVSSLLGSPSTHHAVIEVGGTAIRVPADVLTARIVELEPLRVMFHSYLHALLSQIAQRAACNAVHTLNQRFSRWLLECGDRLDTSEIPATQELIDEVLCRA